MADLLKKVEKIVEEPQRLPQPRMMAGPLLRKVGPLWKVADPHLEVVHSPWWMAGLLLETVFPF